LPPDPPSARWARQLACSRTGTLAPLDEPAFLSPAGAPWLVGYELRREWGRAWWRRLAQRPWTLWRYRELLPVRDFAGRVDLGEGGTPLVRLRRLAPPGVEVWIKEEGGNPTGSFKARGLSLAVNRARELGAPGVELPSTGNAAVALAAYAAAAGLPCRVALPEGTPRAVVRRCREHGAEVLVAGSTLEEAAARLTGNGYWNLATLKEPYRVEGKKTMAFELAEQFGGPAAGGAGQLPDWIVYPTGGGTGIVGMHKAFGELAALGLLTRRPRFAAVQMAGCAPMVRAFEQGRETAAPWERPTTEVRGLRVTRAIGDFLILRALRETGGTAVAVPEEAAAETAHRAARLEGLALGLEGAAALAGLELLAARGVVGAGERAVVFQTGSAESAR
jgi:threonine synthase